MKDETYLIDAELRVRGSSLARLATDHGLTCQQLASMILGRRPWLEEVRLELSELLGCRLSLLAPAA